MESQQEPNEKPRKIVPPLYLLASILVMYVLHRSLPIGDLGGPFVLGFGSAFVSLGMALIVVSLALFKKADTAIIPFHKSTTLVIEGPFKISRNPMYVGMVLILVGVAVGLGSLLPFFVIPLFIYIIRQRFILGEERFMEELFGDAYLDYKKRVRRWI